MKKNLILVVIFAMSLLNVNAQLGKGLKNVGKAVANTAGNIAGELAADAVGNKVADNIVVFMDNSNNVSADDSEYIARLASLVSPNYLTAEGLALNYKVYENPEVNILACANGCIRIYSGMMDILTDDELVAVIATQIGHIANKDCRDALMKVASGDNASNAAGAQLEKMLSLSGEGLGTIVNELIQLPYSDKQNKAADKFAVTLLKKNGASTDGLVSATDKFAEMEANDAQAANDDSIELSPAYKYIRVNSNNASRASIVRSI